ncbi:hypothetical protein Desti_5185 [Desulfomonile tiedjei DSM 6799]|uniref:Uncharacterized protein n=1 Tax=Desulfomonile tiedjei (strain ATCC 49306 / DSM 6799 / DCB-1) TaxID=706587 RepID=I4CDZ5_DESTA|nr:hypothetical protein Desti_5185 [Desulfomonile tiedjei DSM 6799]
MLSVFFAAHQKCFPRLKALAHSQQVSLSTHSAIRVVSNTAAPGANPPSHPSIAATNALVATGSAVKLKVVSVAGGPDCLAYTNVKPLGQANEEDAAEQAYCILKSVKHMFRDLDILIGVAWKALELDHKSRG